jgi:uncharacterized protein with NRDE domain
MCLLILLRGFHRDYPLLCASNRDERTDRPAAPPGLYVGLRHRLLAPRDRQAGGSWIAVDERGRFAGLTNLAGAPPVAGAPSRGLLPLLALDQPDLDAAAAAVRVRLAQQPHAGFQLVLADAERILVMRHAGGVVRLQDWQDPVLVLGNEHGPGELQPRHLHLALAPHADAAQRLAACLPMLRDPGGDGHHAICKRGDSYGTVSSSLLGVPKDSMAGLVWRYAPGPPDTTAFRNYGNLGRRLLPEAPG